MHLLDSVSAQIHIAGDEISPVTGRHARLKTRPFSILGEIERNWPWSLAPSAEPGSRFSARALLNRCLDRTHSAQVCLTNASLSLPGEH